MSLGPALAFSALLSSPGSRYAVLDTYLEASKVAPQREVWLALQVNLKDGYHTYWTNPGDGGLRTEVVLDLPEGWTAKPTQFPTPVRIEKDGTVVFGYEGTVTFLKQIIAPPTGSGKFLLKGTLVMAVCKDSCIPATQTFSIPIELGKEMRRNEKITPRLMAAFRALPDSVAGIGQYRALEDRILVQVPRHPQFTASTFDVMLSEPGLAATKNPILKANRTEKYLQLELQKSEPFAQVTSPLHVLLIPTDLAGKRVGPAFSIFTAPSKDLQFGKDLTE